MTHRFIEWITLEGYDCRQLSMLYALHETKPKQATIAATKEEKNVELP